MNVTAIIPSLNPDDRLISVVEGLLSVSFKDIVIVDDGSDPSSEPIFNTVKKHPEVTVLTHSTNQGKGDALKTAFQFVLENRPDITGVVTVDGDGIHRAGDALRLAAALEKEPEKLWLGVRDLSLPLLPEKLRKGNKITKVVFRLSGGIHLSDTQANLRGISRDLLPVVLNIKGHRYEYETQMLMDLNRQKVRFAELPIDTVLIDETKATHYRPYQDTFQVLKQIFAYVVNSLSCTVVDWLLFTLLNVLLSTVMGDATRILVSTYGARFVASSMNYMINRKLVFHVNSSIHQTILRYILAVTLQAAASYILVLLLSKLFASGVAMQSVLKMCVDVFLAIINYYVQTKWVFAGKE